MNKRILEDFEYVSMLRRMICAAGRRFADSDPEGLALFDSLRSVLDDQISKAALSLSESFSWSEIGKGLSVSKQAAFKRFTGRSCAVRSAPSAKASNGRPPCL